MGSTRPLPRRQVASDTTPMVPAQPRDPAMLPHRKRHAIATTASARRSRAGVGHGPRTVCWRTRRSWQVRTDSPTIRPDRQLMLDADQIEFSEKRIQLLRGSAYTIRCGRGGSGGGPSRWPRGSRKVGSLGHGVLGEQSHGALAEQLLWQPAMPITTAAEASAVTRTLRARLLLIIVLYPPDPALAAVTVSDVLMCGSFMFRLLSDVDDGRRRFPRAGCDSSRLGSLIGPPRVQLVTCRMRAGDGVDPCQRRATVGLPTTPST
jgi:hypothetical protein